MTQDAKGIPPEDAVEREFTCCHWHTCTSGKQAITPDCSNSRSSRSSQETDADHEFLHPRCARLQQRHTETERHDVRGGHCKGSRARINSYAATETERRGKTETHETRGPSRLRQAKSHGVLQRYTVLSCMKDCRRSASESCSCVDKYTREKILDARRGKREWHATCLPTKGLPACLCARHLPPAPGDLYVQHVTISKRHAAESHGKAGSFFSCAKIHSLSFPSPQK